MGIRKQLAILALLLGVTVTPAAAQDSKAQSFSLSSAQLCGVMSMDNMGTGVWQVTAISGATLSWTVSATNTTTAYQSIEPFTPSGTSGSTGTTSTGAWSASVAGYRYMRGCIDTGTATMVLSAVAAGGASGGGGGGGSSSEVVLVDAVGGDPVTSTAADAIQMLQVDTSGDPIEFGIDYLHSEAVADWTLVGGPLSLCQASATAPTAVTAQDAAVFWCGVSGETIVMGNVAHDSPDPAYPIGVGLRAIAHGTNPTAVAAADRTVWFSNRAGVPFVMGGHPNVQSIEVQEQDADNGQTDTALVTCGAGCKVVVTLASAQCDPDTTDDWSVRLGFGTANVPAGTDAGVAGIVLASDGIAPGGGIVRGTGAGILGVGADGEDLRITTADPAGGSCNVIISYYTIES